MFIIPIAPVGSSDFISITHQVLELTLSQSHLPKQNAAQFSADVPIHTVPVLFHLVTINAGWTEAVGF